MSGSAKNSAAQCPELCVGKGGLAHAGRSAARRSAALDKLALAAATAGRSRSKTWFGAAIFAAARRADFRTCVRCAIGSSRKRCAKPELAQLGAQPCKCADVSPIDLCSGRRVCPALPRTQWHRRPVLQNVRAKPTAEADAGWPRKDNFNYGLERPDGGCRSGSALERGVRHHAACSKNSTLTDS
jgi:hypothetical protein